MQFYSVRTLNDVFAKQVSTSINTLATPCYIRIKNVDTLFLQVSTKYQQVSTNRAKSQKWLKIAKIYRLNNLYLD